MQQMKYIIIIFTFLSSFSVLSQEIGKDFDFEKKFYPVKNSIQTDSLKFWTYSIDYEFNRPNDSIKPVGQIKFWRTKSIDDKKNLEIYGRPWTPSIDFDIYNITDLPFCVQAHININTASSCLSPNVGGDLFIIQNYVLINRWVCVNCIRYDNGIDYCRPTLNKILSELELTENSSLREFDKAIIMKIQRSE
jgi:hypothetical protein